jgi:hypothetical protein
MDSSKKPRGACEGEDVGILNASAILLSLLPLLFLGVISYFLKPALRPRNQG